MPQIAGHARRRAVGMELAHPRIVAFLAVGFLADMLADGAEILGEPGMVVMADFLVAEEQHLVFDKGAVTVAPIAGVYWVTVIVRYSELGPAPSISTSSLVPDVPVPGISRPFPGSGTS